VSVSFIDMDRRHLGPCFLLGIVLLAMCVTVSAEPEETSYVNFSFDRVDIRLLVKLVGEMTGRQFVMDDGVKGDVTVVTSAQVPSDQAYPLLLSILESIGYSVVEQENLYHVVSLPAEKVRRAPVVTGQEDVLTEGIITKVISLEHVGAVELQRILAPMVRGGDSGALAAFGPTNHLIVTDTAENIRRLEQIIARLDMPGASSAMEVLHLQHAAAEDVAGQVMAAVLASQDAGSQFSRHVKKITGGGASLPGGVAVVPSAQANSLIVVGSPLQLKEIKRIVSLLDQTEVAGRGPLNAVFLKYLSADEAAKSLNALLDKGGEKDESVRRRIAIEPNTANNALLISASPRDYEWVRDLVKQLDLIPQQVLMEVLIAEVTLGKNLDLGVEWASIDAPQNGSTTVIGRSRPGKTDSVATFLKDGIFPQGLTFGLARGTYTDASGNIVPRIPFILRALARDNKVELLSNVPLLSQNNKEASVSVVENIPMLKSTIEGGAGTARDVIQNIERTDVGIKLKLTPQINKDQDVLMSLNLSIEAVVDEGPEGKYTPTIAKREVMTTVTVPDRATVAITGLIREDKLVENHKVPILGDIPLLGALFRRKSTSKKRTNLLILVTPHVVTDQKSAQAMKKRLEMRTGLGPTITNFNKYSHTGEKLYSEVGPTDTE